MQAHRSFRNFRCYRKRCIGRRSGILCQGFRHHLAAEAKECRCRKGVLIGQTYRFCRPEWQRKIDAHLTNRAFFDIPRVNVDEIVREIGGNWRNSADLIRAGKIALRRAKNCLEKKVSFNRETTLCGKTAVRDIIEAKRLGFEVELYFVYLSSVDIAKERVRHRVACGGHGIPEADIERRYTESLRRLQEVMPLCDKVELYDNSVQFIKVLTFKNSRLTYSAENVPDWAKLFLKA